LWTIATCADRIADTLYKHNAPRTVGNSVILTGPFNRDATPVPTESSSSSTTSGSKSDDASTAAAAAAAAAEVARSRSSSHSLFGSDAAGTSDSYMVLFKYGSVVCFNMDLDDQAVSNCCLTSFNVVFITLAFYVACCVCICVLFFGKRM
jgi:uncharacterized Rmd1/YagE family protein